MLADKTGVERGQAWLVKSSFCQKAACRQAQLCQHQEGRRNRRVGQPVYFLGQSEK